MTPPEVVVIGAGIAGTATARELAVRGVDVLLLDSGEVSGGTTGLGEGNVLCCDKVPGPELDLTVLGVDLYDEIEQRMGQLARIRRKGALLVHPGERTWAAEPARLEAMRAAGVRCRTVEMDELREREPNLDGSVCGASLFADDLQCDPRAIARELAREAQVAGATVRTHASVESIDTAAGAVSGVRLSEGERIEARAVVVAAGPWSRPLAESAGIALPLEPRKGQLVKLARPPGEQPWVNHKVVDGSYLEAVASDDAALQISTVIETTWEGDVLVGSSRERRGFDTSTVDAVSDALVEHAGRLFGAVTGLERDAAWAGLRAWLPDHLPAIGPSTEIEGLWLATGHEGAGVGQGPITGRLIAQAFSGEPTALDLAPFSPDRF